MQFTDEFTREVLNCFSRQYGPDGKLFRIAIYPCVPMLPTTIHLLAMPGKSVGLYGRVARDETPKITKLLNEKSV